MNDGMITQSLLKEILHYEPDTGVFTWRVRLSKNTHIGDIAGTPFQKYRRIGIGGRLYRAHRLAWLYVHGVWPSKEIDHIDGDWLNNRLTNLRDVSSQINAQNRKRARADNKTGFLGVSQVNGRFLAQIRTGHVSRNLGFFDSPELAHAAYVQAKRKYHAGCTL